MDWYWIFLIVICSLLILFFISIIFYVPFLKRFYDIILSGIGILILSPLLIVLIITGTIAMRGNPFFCQKRPGKHEKPFKLIKFRSMNNKKGEDGMLLSDSERLTKYGNFLRKTSLDELPELFNILIGSLSFVGPRPLLMEYLPYYNENERHRHDVRPGLTGLSQINGRNFLSWDERFKYDIQYISNVSLFLDIKIIIKTAFLVINRKDIADRSAIFEENDGNKYIMINGQKKKYPKALNVERGKNT